MDLNIINPKPFVNSLVGQKVLVKLKFNNTSYTGKLQSSDNYLNLLLSDPEEVVEGSDPTKLVNDLFIRCNNVLYIRQLDQEGDEEKGDVEVEDKVGDKSEDKSEDVEVREE